MFALLVGALLAQRLFELALAERNRRWALRNGGKESGQRHYPLLVCMHILFYLSLCFEYAFLARGWDRFWHLWLGAVLVAQCVRVWAVASLGRMWNTRIIVVPGLKPVRKGPYRLIRHPNYAVVAVEVLAVPMMCGAYFTALVFSLVNAFLLSIRIREEERALETIGGSELGSLPRFIPRFVRRKAYDPDPGERDTGNLS